MPHRVPTVTTRLKYKAPPYAVARTWPGSPSELVPRLTHRIAAVLVDDDPVRKRLIVGLNVQSAISRIQRVFLDKINVIYSCNL